MNESLKSKVQGPKSGTAAKGRFATECARPRVQQYPIWGGLEPITTCWTGQELLRPGTGPLRHGGVPFVVALRSRAHRGGGAAR